MPKGKALMIQGTASYAGKTTLVAALCRILARAGLRVAPFKAQNMSLNSYVTPDGKEISRAQALQALAAGIEPRVEMNPILLKPKGGAVSQVMLMGEPYHDVSAEKYYSEFALNAGIRAVEKSLNSLTSEYEVVVIEGAGSPAEINLYDREIANMRVARLADAPVFLVADIERGGVFASVVGTISLLEPGDRERVKGVIINKFRGDRSILELGLKKLEKLTGKPVLGVLPYVQNLNLPWEDSVALDDLENEKGGTSSFKVALIRLPFISNFTDVHPLIAAGMHVYQVRSSNELGNPDLVVIPGTKNSVHDLIWLKREGLDKEILRLRGNGVPIIGICGGYQMLGKKLLDPRGIEGGTIGEEHEGLGLLDVETRFASYTKRTLRVSAEVLGEGPVLGRFVGKRIRAYEIHMGETKLGSDQRPFRILSTNGSRAHDDGAMSSDGLVIGSYMHGLFDDGTITRALLNYLSRKKGKGTVPGIGEEGGASIEKAWESSLDLFCTTLCSSVDIERILEIAQVKAEKIRGSWKPLR